MNEYFSLANYYDRLMCDNDYSAWADYYEKIFKDRGIRPHTILDLACGTGKLTCILAARGYDMTGVDVSPEMLAQAQARAENSELVLHPMFINQDLRELDMYGTYDAAICSFDGLNYVPPSDIAGVFKRISYFIQPGGALIFDVNTEEKFHKMDGMTYVDEDDGLFCVWRTDYSEKEKACTYGVDIFFRQGKAWQRRTEEHTEYTHSPEKLKKLLSECGFTDICVCSELSFDAPADDEDRIFFMALRT